MKQQADGTIPLTAHHKAVDSMRQVNADLRLKVAWLEEEKSDLVENAARQAATITELQGKLDRVDDVPSAPNEIQAGV